MQILLDDFLIIQDAKDITIYMGPFYSKVKKQIILWASETILCSYQGIKFRYTNITIKK